MIQTIDKPPIGDVLTEIINDYGLLAVVRALLKRLIPTSPLTLPAADLNDHLRHDIGLGPAPSHPHTRAQLPPRLF